jgi:predicted transcriptional regulator
LVKIGDALKKAVEEESPVDDEPDKRKARTTSVLMNKNRRRIFRFLCIRPCLTINDLTSALSVSRATISWHLKILSEAGYVDSFLFYKKKVYYPMGMMSKGDVLKVVATLNESQSRQLFKEINENHGINTTALHEYLQSSSSFASGILKLEKAGLISCVKDGRQLRYFPTAKLGEIVKSEGSRLKEFRRSLIKRMKKEHLNIEIKEIKGTALVLILKFQEKREEIQIPYRPIEGILAIE